MNPDGRPGPESAVECSPLVCDAQLWARLLLPVGCSEKSRSWPHSRTGYNSCLFVRVELVGFLGWPKHGRVAYSFTRIRWHLEGLSMHADDPESKGANLTRYLSGTPTIRSGKHRWSSHSSVSLNSSIFFTFYRLFFVDNAWWIAGLADWLETFSHIQSQTDELFLHWRRLVTWTPMGSDPTTYSDRNLST